MELGAWSLELGAWSLELGAWSLRVGLGGKKHFYPKSKKIHQKVANCFFNFCLLQKLRSFPKSSRWPFGKFGLLFFKPKKPKVKVKYCFC